jgi:hypothetical protein
MSGCTYTDPNSVRKIDPVGHTSRQPARSQCLQTSLIISQENCGAAAGTGVWMWLGEISGPSTLVGAGCPRGFSSANAWSDSTPSRGEPCPGSGSARSTNATWRQVDAPRRPVLS